jgi:hypothetical protein
MELKEIFDNFSLVHKDPFLIWEAIGEAYGADFFREVFQHLTFALT